MSDNRSPVLRLPERELEPKPTPSVEEVAPSGMMTQKERFDAIADMRSFYWNSFDKRRTYEWRVSIAFWAVIVGAIGFAVRGDATLPERWSLWLISGAILSLHALFILNLVAANRLDRAQAFFFANHLLPLVDLEFTPEIKDAVVKRCSGKRRHWSPFVQIAITAVLLLVLNGVTGRAMHTQGISASPSTGPERRLGSPEAPGISASRPGSPGSADGSRP